MPQSIARQHEFRSRLKAVKRLLAKQLPDAKSTHLTEAIAAGLGYPTHRRLLLAIEDDSASAMRFAAFDGVAFGKRLAALGCRVPENLEVPNAATVLDWFAGSVFGIHLVIGSTGEALAAGTSAVLRSYAKARQVVGTDPVVRCLIHRDGAVRHLDLLPNADGVSMHMDNRVLDERTVRGQRPSRLLFVPRIEDIRQARAAVEHAVTGNLALAGIVADSVKDAMDRLSALGVGSWLKDDPLVFAQVAIVDMAMFTTIPVTSYPDVMASGPRLPASGGSLASRSGGNPHMP